MITLEDLRQQALDSFGITWHTLSINPDDVLAEWGRAEFNTKNMDQYARDRIRACKVYHIAKEQGLTAALLWKLADE